MRRNEVYMKIQLTSFDIRSESDIALSHHLAKHVASLAGFNLTDQIRFATAVCEITCNVIEHADSGNAIFNWQMNGHAGIEAVITDRGAGIKSLDKILKRDPARHKGTGLGLVHARSLCDHFDISTGDSGTTVVLQKTFAGDYVAPGQSTIKKWQKQLKEDSTPLTLECLKQTNHHFRELTEECKRKEEKIRQQADEITAFKSRAQQHEKNMKEFSHTVSHDLRTPLTSLGLSLSLIDMDEIPELERSNIQIAARSAKRLETMIKGLLEILAMHNPSREVIKRIDIQPLVQKTITEVTQGLEETSYHFSVSIAKGLSIVYNEPFLEGIFSHLLTNAVKYRREVPLQVGLNIEPTQEGIRIRYQDNGAGIDLVTNARKLFAPFSRFTTESDGKGNGLYMIKTMAENNGGSVQLESEVGTGTKFMIDLVAYKEEPPGNAS
jgi:signal transduction histidine kinase